MRGRGRDTSDTEGQPGLATPPDAAAQAGLPAAGLPPDRLPAVGVPGARDSHPAPGQPTGPVSGRRPLPRAGAAGLALAVVLVIGAAALAIALRPGHGRHDRSVAYGLAHSDADRSARQRTLAAGPLRLVSLDPVASARQVDGAAPLQISFSVPLAAGTAVPAIRPAVHGVWRASGTTLTFSPARPLPPSTRFAVRIPSGQAGIRSAAGRTLPRTVVVRFVTAGYAQLRLDELLAQLGYLPLTWRPVNGGRPDQFVGAGVAAQRQLAYQPPAGIFSWVSGYPRQLRAQWRPGQPSTLVRGAIMAFQAQHGMAIDGVAGGPVWLSLFRAAAAGQANKAGYTYAIASQRLPERLTIWHDGRIVLRSLANTGIPVRPTADGTYPVYLRFRDQIMRGTNPDGSTYADPVSYVAYFNGGDAVHYFPRGSYGSPQSLGCVELPYPQAQKAWPYLTYGSLVTVTG